MRSTQPLSISEITHIVAEALARDSRLQELWLEGEVSNFKRPQSGHAYFTLKDSGSQIRCVMWRSSMARSSFIPGDGDRVRAHGKVEVYPEGGTYQFYADSLQPSGVGDLYQQFERLKAKLQAEGLFDAAHKRPLPAYPEVIGVVTSPSAAAFQDVQNVLRRRFPMGQVLLSPTPVQGADAPPQIVRAIEALAVDGRAQVILVVRGGGSIEELWAFNDEGVARAVYASPIPVVTGVGHEIDFTLVDFVSDRRAPTPSAAAELITPDQEALRAEVNQIHQGLYTLIQGMIEERRAALAVQNRALGWLSPQKLVHSQAQRVDELSLRAFAAIGRTIEKYRERLEARDRALSAANPEGLLKRGYAIVTRSDGKRITDALDTAPGAAINIRLGRGSLRATVRDRTLAQSEPDPQGSPATNADTDPLPS